MCTMAAAGPQDWSDFALWWPERNIWLNRPRLALSSEGVQSDSKLHFLRINQVLQVQLPDRTVVKMPVNMVVRCFHAVEQVCLCETSSYCMFCLLGCVISVTPCLSWKCDANLCT